jgi:hypothetical protein
MIFTHMATLQGALTQSTHPSPTLTTWSSDSRLLSWPPPPTYFDILLCIEQSVISAAPL